MSFNLSLLSSPANISTTPAATLTYISTTTSSNQESDSSNSNQFHFNNFNTSINDVNPRKYSIIPASPPTNIDLDINETGSIETILNSYVTSTHLNNYNRSVNSKFGNNQHSLVGKNLDSFDKNNNIQRHKYKLETDMDEFGNNGKIELCLDKWYTELKGHVLSEFEKSRIEILQEQQKRLIEEKEKQTSEIIKLKKELDKIKENLKAYEINLVKKDEAIENLNKALDKQKEKHDLLHVMSEWKLKRVERIKDAFGTKLADNYYQYRIKLKIYMNWYVNFIEKVKQKFEKKLKKKAEEVCFNLASRYEAKIKKIEEELKKSKQEVESYKFEMAKNEENMKKALMRGVCALNLEAMSILNESNMNFMSTANSNNNSNLIENQPFTQMSDLQLNPHLYNNSSESYANAKQQDQMNDRARKAKPPAETKENASYLRKSLPAAQVEDSLHDSVLSRKVKEYCDQNLKLSSSQLSKLKVKIPDLNENSEMNQVYHQNPANPRVLKQNQSIINSNQEQNMYDAQTFINTVSNKLNVSGKVYDELTQHPLPVQKTISSRRMIKSKIGSLPPINTKTNQLINIITERNKHGLANKQNTQGIMVEKHSDKSGSGMEYSYSARPSTIINNVKRSLSR